VVRARLSILILLLAPLAACHEREDTTPADDQIPEMPSSLSGGSHERPVGPRSETPGVSVIYAMSLEKELIAFDPATSSVQLVAHVACPTSPDDGPRAMSVDAHGTAWVLYRSGEVFWVATDNGKCRRSTWQPGRDGWMWFGMGFVRDPDGGEALYVSGTGGSDRDGQLGRIDPDTARVTAIGRLPDGEQNAELAGGDAASLYAYYPGRLTSFVAKIDRASGRALQTWELPTAGGYVYAWAAASLGGQIFLFATHHGEDGAEHSKVLRFDPKTGETSVAREETPYAIVGAGVGERAPVVVR
jgi:hypothetical protein